MSEVEVKPCPFCGFKDVEIGEVDLGCYAVDCPECECIGPIVRTSDGDLIGMESAIEEWNKAMRAAA